MKFFQEEAAKWIARSKVPLVRTQKELIMKDLDKYKPAVTSIFLLFLAGIVWELVGMMLLFLAFSWLSKASRIDTFLFSGAGILLALMVHHFGFLKIVDKNLERIRQMNGKRCLFSFVPWKSYVIIVVMVTMGVLLRHSMIPKIDLSILYIGMGLALMLSGVRYLRVFYREITRRKSV